VAAIRRGRGLSLLMLRVFGNGMPRVVSIDGGVAVTMMMAVPMTIGGPGMISVIRSNSTGCRTYRYHAR
jgi:hypothetical protein